MTGAQGFGMSTTDLLVDFHGLSIALCMPALVVKPKHQTCVFTNQTHPLPKMMIQQLRMVVEQSTLSSIDGAFYCPEHTVSSPSVECSNSKMSLCQTWRMSSSWWTWDSLRRMLK